jgi:Fucosyltransferase, N-terminal
MKLQKCLVRFLKFVTALLCLQIVVSMFFYPMSNVKQLQKLDHLKPKTIVFWTDFYGIPFWGFAKETFNQTDLEAMKCPVTNCIITHRKDLINIEDSDAVIFHVGSGNHWLEAPKVRKPESQMYIMASKE